MHRGVASLVIEVLMQARVIIVANEYATTPNLTSAESLASYPPSDILTKSSGPAGTTSRYLCFHFRLTRKHSTCWR